MELMAGMEQARKDAQSVMFSLNGTVRTVLVVALC